MKKNKAILVSLVTRIPDLIDDQLAKAAYERGVTKQSIVIAALERELAKTARSK